MYLMLKYLANLTIGSFKMSASLITGVQKFWAPDRSSIIFGSICLTCGNVLQITSIMQTAPEDGFTGRCRFAVPKHGYYFMSHFLGPRIVVHVFLLLSMYSYCYLCILIVRTCILIFVYVFLLLSMYSYCYLCILIVIYVFLIFVHVFLSLSMYSYCFYVFLFFLCILIVIYVFLLFVHVILSLSMYSYCYLCILIVRPCILIFVYVFLFCLCILIVVYVFLLLSMYSYCYLCILIVIYVLLEAATLTEVFPCFFLSCNANARV